MLVDFFDKSASYSVLLVWRKYKDLRYCDWSLWNFLELIKCGRVGDKLMVHVNQEVIPIFIDWYSRGTFNVELKKSL